MTVHQSPLLKKRLAVLLFSFFLLAFSLLPVTLAWFTASEEGHNFEGDALLGYFESGDGSQEKPYIIATPKHFYNLAWLQNIGAFEGRTPYLKIVPKDGNVLNMADALMGTKERTGAIPPIGTKDNPFIGILDGNGAVIQNLWVSTDERDWYERPQSYTEFPADSGVGLFGNVGFGANISNFFLENVEVTTTVDGDIGILAGYVDGDINTVGIKNAKLSFKDDQSCQVSSDFSLIGAISENVVWQDFPLGDGGSGDGEGGSGDGDEGGNELIIVPYVDQDKVNHEGYTMEDVVMVTGSKEGHAYYVKSVSSTLPNPQPDEDKVYKYTGSVSFSSTSTPRYYMEKGSISGPYDIGDEHEDNPPGDLDPDFIKIFQDENGTDRSTMGFSISSVPDFSNDAIDAYGYPANGIWFDPIAAGQGVIAFARTNNSANYENMSLYRYKRNNGYIDTVEEIIFSYPKKNGPANKGTAYFEFTLTTEDLDYEYVIGRSSVDAGGNASSASFIFLKLPGADITGGEGDGGGSGDGGTIQLRYLNDIDFVANTAVSLAELEMHKSVLELEGTQAGSGALYYNVQTYGTVLYADESSTLTLTQKVPQSEAQASQITFSEGSFPSFPVRLTDTAQAALWNMNEIIKRSLSPPRQRAFSLA